MWFFWNDDFYRHLIKILHLYLTSDIDFNIYFDERTILTGKFSKISRLKILKYAWNNLSANSKNNFWTFLWRIKSLIFQKFYFEKTLKKIIFVPKTFLILMFQKYTKKNVSNFQTYFSIDFFYGVSFINIKFTRNYKENKIGLD